MSAIRNNSGRDRTLDFVKGVLVVFMILYHWINYFVSVDGFGYRYLRFVTPSFIFIAGFLVSNSLIGRYGALDLRLPARLLVRGTKILMLFTILNIGTLYLKHGSAGELRDGFISYFGTADAPEAAFQVLVPIAYLLAVCSGILVLRRSWNLPIQWTCGILFSGILIADLCGVVVANLELIGVGILGVLLGTVSMDRIRSLERRKAGFLAIYALYVVAVWFLDVAYPLQIVGVCLNLLLFHYVGTMWEGENIVFLRVVRLGCYSLFSYIAQIVILQGLRPVLRGVGDDAISATLALIAVLILTESAVAMVDFTRQKFRSVDRLYKFAFA